MAWVWGIVTRSIGVVTAIFLFDRLTTLDKILGLQCPLPATWQVVAQDLGIYSATMTKDLMRECPGYMDDHTRLFGNTRYHLFGRTYDDVAALRLIAKKYHNFETDRRVVSELTKYAVAVNRAFGDAAMATLNGHNFNAKVPSFTLPSLLSALMSCLTPPPLFVLSLAQKTLTHLWKRQLQQCGYLPRETTNHTPAASVPELTSASPAVATGSIPITPARKAADVFETPNAGVPGTPRTRSSGSIPAGAPQAQQHARGNKLWARFWKDVEKGAVDPGVICVFQLVQAHKKDWGTRQLKKRAAELGKAMDPFRTKVLYEVMGNRKEGPSKVDFSRFVLLFQDF